MENQRFKYACDANAIKISQEDDGAFELQISINPFKKDCEQFLSFDAYTVITSQSNNKTKNHELLIGPLDVRLLSLL